jgi:hypothetical protein
MQTIITSLITGGLFWHLSSDYSAGGLSNSFNSKNGVSFFIALETFMTSLTPIMLTFPL